MCLCILCGVICSHCCELPCNHTIDDMQWLPLNFVKVYESLTILRVCFIHDGECWICIALLFEQQSIHVYCCCWSCVSLHIVFSTIVLTCTPGSMMSWSSCVQHITMCKPCSTSHNVQLMHMLIQMSSWEQFVQCVVCQHDFPWCACGLVMIDLYVLCPQLMSTNKTQLMSK